MQADPLDDAFVRLNQELKLIPPDRISAARQIQEAEFAASQARRSLIDILHRQGVISEEVEARFRERIAAEVLAPRRETERRLAEVDLPNDEMFWAATEHSILDLSLPDETKHEIESPGAEAPPEVQKCAKDASRQFGKFTLVAELALGTYRAWDKYIGRFVVLKRPRVSADAVGPLVRAGRRLVKLRYPNIAAVHEIARVEDQIYVARDFVEGRSLADEIKEAQAHGRPSPLFENPARCLRALRDVARALSYAHAQSPPFVHGRLAPSNVFIDACDRGVAADFALEPAGDSRADVRGLGTVVRALLGSKPPPAYAALEKLCARCLPQSPSLSAGDVASALNGLLRELQPESSSQLIVKPPAASPADDSECRQLLGTRAAYAWLRRSGREPGPAAAGAADAFARAGASDLRDGLLQALPSAASDGPPAAGVEPAEQHLPSLAAEPSAAFAQMWAAETVRLSLGLFHAESERVGRRELYAELHECCRWGRGRAPGSRLQRRSQRRFREILRGIVALVRPGADADADVRALAGQLPTGKAACARCGGGADTTAIDPLYAGVCPGCALKLAIDPAPALEEVGPYEVVGRIGHDALGDIYRVRSSDDSKDLRLRLIPDRKAVELARTAMVVKHDAALTIHDAGEFEGKAYVVTDLVQGPSLRAAVSAAGFARERGIAMVRSLAEAVRHMHVHGVVHGSLDSTKVVVGPDGAPRIGDYCYGRRTDEARVADVAGLCEIYSRCTGTPVPKTCRTLDEFAAMVGVAPGQPRPQPSAPAAAPQRPVPAIAALPPPPAQTSVPLIVAGVVALAAIGIGIGLAVRSKEPTTTDPSGGGTTTTAAPPAVVEDPREVKRRESLAALGALLEKAADRREIEACGRAAEAHARDWPADAHGHWTLGYVGFLQGRPADADRHAREALKRDETLSHAWMVVGLAAMERFDFTAARDALGRAQAPELNWKLPDPAGLQADALLARGLLAYARGELVKAQEQIGESIQKQGTPEACRWLGFCSSDARTNINCQTQALKQRPDYAAALIERGIAHSALLEWKKALEDLDRGLKGAPDYGRGLLHRGAAHAALGDLDNAHADLSRAVQLRADDARGWLERARVRHRKRDFKGSLEDASEAVKRAPSSAECVLERGRAYWKLKQEDEAELDFLRAVELDPRLKAEVARVKKE